MDNNTEIVLSVLVVSHNQCHLLSRCLDSILSQRIDVPYEVIVSDDRSTDGTWQLIEDYQHRYPTIVRGVKCNSDECNPSGRSERCGWNKANAYRHATGEFFVNIDADDYLRSDDIYQFQLDALRAHPECAMCQQRIWQVRDGAPLQSGYAWPQHPKLKEGAILNATDLIHLGLIGLNPTYMIRRNPLGENPANLFGKLFDDTLITYYHLQFGKVVFIDRADYVWVQYGASISNSDKGFDRQLLYALLPWQHALLIPHFRHLFASQYNRNLSKIMRRSLLHHIPIGRESIRYCSQFPGFIFQYFAQGQRGLSARFRIARALLLYRRIHHHKPIKRQDTDRLYKLLIK